MERQEIDYMNFLKNIVRLRNSLSYIQARDMTASDILGLAAVYEIERLDNENS